MSESINFIKPDTDKLISQVKKIWPEIKLINPSNLSGNQISGLVTFCPLYAKGQLSDSYLLTNPTSISESRVANKWNAVAAVVTELTHQLALEGRSLELTGIFANKGVLLNHAPSYLDDAALLQHEKIYRREFAVLTDALGIPAVFTNYDELEVDYDRYVNLQGKPGLVGESMERDGSVHDMINLINIFAAQHGLPDLVKDNKDNRNPVKQMLEAFGFEGAYWLITGYLAFDYKIPQIIGRSGLYISVERFGPLFRIAHLTPSLKGVPRLEVTA